MKNFRGKLDKAEILQNIWIELAAAAQTRHHAWHLMQLSSISNNAPTIRTVVLRAVDEPRASVICHTDVRSPKVMEIHNNPGVCWHAYDPEQRIQIRLSARAEINHQDAYAHTRWEESSLDSRLCYANRYAPSEHLPASSDLEKNSVLKEAFDDLLAEKNFAVITSVIHSIEWLYLRHEGHSRVRFDRNNGAWEGKWLAP